MSIHWLASARKKAMEREKKMRKLISVIVLEINQHEKGNIALYCVERLLIHLSLENLSWPK